ncbi:AMP-dependent synthetase/ligase [Oceanicella actignis]|uniref:Long-chain acyl-CoA synthetase n=1 Tax=Oceanicella actignis TaxID=1189325 RepID=A0A1M7S2R4_9RHOB|nr:long-chain fatty acid--CoA ligase [Oceanicella actignis]TYO90192.1 long-chain acyl-CoA synthetase [Oceanicella actignis]SES89903.1 long-chain acyl-CoA synthetase [Oceanicella actignis]SHN52803.1 long-chain acyl-CoA synthetase [Oceanicella actignis]
MTQATRTDAAIAPDAPILVDGCDTIARLFAHRCRVKGDAVAHREKELGIWREFSWNDYYDNARLIGLALARLGMERGDVVSILSEDRKEWLYVDMGVVCMGGVTNGVYTTDSAEQLAYLVNDSGSRFLFLENEEQLDKWLEVRDRMPTLVKVIVFEREGLRGFSDPMVMFHDELLGLGAEALQDQPRRFEEELEKARPEDTMMLIYTSGTTGPPKGAMITHRNMIYQLHAGLEILDFRETDELLCFLPLCHVLERLVSVEFPLAAGVVVNFAESPETVFDNLREVSPHSFTAVPRLWEKIYSRIRIMRSEATAFGRWCFDRAIETGLEAVRLQEEGKPLPPMLRLRRAFWDWAALRNVRALIGLDRARRGTTGAAPISPELIRWFGALGVPLLEGYGMTETSGVATANTLEDNVIGTVGKPLPGTEIRISPEGEILVRGPNVFKGYWNKPDKTAETIDAEGWLHTGDVGRLGNDGALTITGRMKDIIITAGGKNITPAEIESRLKFSPYIADAVVIGDRRKYLTCLVMIDQENVEKYAQDRRVPFSDFASLCAAPEVRELIAAEIAEVNKAFARVEQIKDFRLIDVLLTAEDEELTPTMKLKRGFVEKKHKALIDDMYGAQ